MSERPRVRDAQGDGPDSATAHITGSARILAFPDRGTRLILGQHAAGRDRLEVIMIRTFGALLPAYRLISARVWLTSVAMF